MIGIVIALLLYVGILDLYLVKKHLPTISNRIHKWFPYSTDLGVAIGIAGLYWWQLSESIGIIFILGLITGHLFWGEGN